MQFSTSGDCIMNGRSIFGYDKIYGGRNLAINFTYILSTNKTLMFGGKTNEDFASF